MMENLMIAYIQADLAWESVDQNLAHFDQLLNQISQAVDLVVLPESFNTAFCTKINQVAEIPGGPSSQFLIQKAKTLNTTLCASLFIKENDAVYNRLLWVRPDGSCEHYDKRHAFCLSEEKHAIKRGEELKTFMIKGWKIRPFICYDLRFPCWMRNQYQEGEGFAYDLALVIANWPVQRAHAWKSLSIARAIENVAYMTIVNRIGQDAYKNLYAGSSMILNFKGDIISAAVEGIETIQYATLDPIALQDFREKFPVHLDWDKQ